MTAKGGFALKRDRWSPKWGHKDPSLDAKHMADEHESGAGGWLCYECHEKVVIVSSSMRLVGEPAPDTEVRLP